MHRRCSWRGENVRVLRWRTVAKCQPINTTNHSRACNQPYVDVGRIFLTQPNPTQNYHETLDPIQLDPFLHDFQFCHQAAGAYSLRPKTCNICLHFLSPPLSEVNAIARDVCLSVCLSVSKITQKRVHGFGWPMSGHGRTDQLLSADAGTGLLSPISYALQHGILLRGENPTSMVIGRPSQPLN